MGFVDSIREKQERTREKQIARLKAEGLRLKREAAELKEVTELRMVVNEQAAVVQSMGQVERDAKPIGKALKFLRSHREERLSREAKSEVEQSPRRTILDMHPDDAEMFKRLRGL